MAADPTIDNEAGTAVLDFADDTGWTLSKAKTGTVLDETAMVLVPQNYDFYDDFEDSTFTDWYDDNMAVSTVAGDFIDTQSMSPSGSQAGDADQPRFDFDPADTLRTIVVMFKSPVEIGFKEFWISAQAASGSIAMPGYLDFGWDPDDATYPDKWLYQVSAGGTQSAGDYEGETWHKLVISTALVSQIPLRTYQLISFDGSETFYDSASNPPDAALDTSYGTLGLVFSGGATDDLVVDEVILSSDNAIYEEGTGISPLVLPDYIQSWDSVTIDDDTTGIWLGTATYDVQYTTDGGSNYGTNSPDYDDGNYETLNDANLAAVTVDRDANDGLRVRVTHTPDATISHLNNNRKAWIPRTNGVTINFTPNWAESSKDTQSWTEASKDTQSWTEATKDTQSWSEASKDTQTWTEATKDTQSWVEQ